MLRNTYLDQEDFDCYGQPLYPSGPPSHNKARTKQESDTNYLSFGPFSLILSRS